MQPSQFTDAESNSAHDARLVSLTDKQLAVLELLVQFKTSKEISRLLAISPHTVDQRIEAAKTKLGATSRAQLALIYRDLRGDSAVYERLTYEEFPIAEPRILAQQSSAVGTAFAPPTGPDSSSEVGPDPKANVDYRVVPEIFDGRWGTIARLLTIVAIAAVFSIAFLGCLAIFVQVSNLFRR